MYQDIVIRGIGAHRGGPRLYLDMPELQNAEFKPGCKFRVEVDEEERRITLALDQQGERKVSSKERSAGRRISVVDLASSKLLGIFGDFQRVRIVFMKGCIWVLPLASDLARSERIGRLLGKLDAGEPISTASICHGMGLLSLSAEEGLREGGVGTACALITDIDEKSVAHSRAKNPVWQASTIGITAPLQELMQDELALAGLPKVDLLEAGLPCSGAAKPGVAKRGLEKMEDHPEVGHMVAPFLAILPRLQPSIVVIENVVGYKTTASASLLRNVMRDMGYEITEVILHASKFGQIEARVRWFMIAVTKGICLDLVDLEQTSVKAPALSSVLETFPEDDERWREMTYLKEKAARDKEAGQGFKMQRVSMDATSVPALRKGYAKMGTTDPLLEHPSRPGLLRKFTAGEHAAIKGFDKSLIEGLSQYRAHEMLGQGVAKAPVVALFKRIAEQLLSCARGHQTAQQEVGQEEPYALSGTG